MAGQERVFEVSQGGIESVRGTAVPATRKLYTRWQPFPYERELAFIDAATGTLEPNIDAAYARPGPVPHTGVEAMTFEDTAWWFQFLLRGGVTGGAGDAGVPPMYVYDFDPSVTSDLLKSATLERGTTTLPYEFNQFMVSQGTIRIVPDDERFWMFDIEGMSRKPTQVAMTGSIGDRTRTPIRSVGTKLFIDAGAGTVGTTQVTGRFIGGSVTVLNELDFKAFAEDEDDVAANKVGLGPRVVTAQFTFEHDSDVEFANARGNTPVERLVRLEKIGPVIHDAVTNRIRLDMYGYWSTVAQDYRNNNKIITLTLNGRRNPTAAYTINAEIQNDEATLV